MSCRHGSGRKSIFEWRWVVLGSGSASGRARICYGHSMRYHKAVEITHREADSIIATGGASLTSVVVVSLGDKWFDVRSMTRAECEAFFADLARAEIAADGEEAKKSRPN